MISSADRGDGLRSTLGSSRRTAAEEDGAVQELERLRAENRRLAISLGGFSAFIASKGLLEEAWHYVHAIHQIEEGEAA